MNENALTWLILSEFTLSCTTHVRALAKQFQSVASDIVSTEVTKGKNDPIINSIRDDEHVIAMNA